ncbi:MAG: DUF3011 domain-containing protein [Pseudomonadota bacterium]|nr:DUF3011 domain-containing protein [Pseudomonadota bacterium]
MVCESRSGARRECQAADAKRVDLVRQLSNAACSKGESWDWDGQRIWVDRGCRAEFIVW